MLLLNCSVCTHLTLLEVIAREKSEELAQRMLPKAKQASKRMQRKAY